MILTKQHLIEMLNIIAETNAFYDDCENIGDDIITAYNSPFGEYHNYFESFLEEVCNESWTEDDELYDVFYDLMQGREKYENSTLEQRLGDLLEGPDNQLAVFVNEIEIDTDELEDGQNYKTNLNKSYQEFSKLKTILVTLVCGEGVEPSANSRLGRIQKSYDELMK